MMVTRWEVPIKHESMRLTQCDAVCRYNQVVTGGTNPRVAVRPIDNQQFATGPQRPGSFIHKCYFVINLVQRIDNDSRIELIRSQSGTPD